MLQLATPPEPQVTAMLQQCYNNITTGKDSKQSQNAGLSPPFRPSVDAIEWDRANHHLRRMGKGMHGFAE